MKKNEFIKPKMIIGLIHLDTLPPYKESGGVKSLIKKALEDLEHLQGGGVDGIIVENQWDHPHTVKISPVQAMAFSIIVNEMMKKAKVPIGLSVLLNDWENALNLVKVCGSGFVRLDVFVDSTQDLHWGYRIKEDPKKILAYKKQIGADGVILMTDIQVKYKKMLEKKTKVQSAKQAVRAGSDIVVVTGQGNMRGPKIEDLVKVKKAIPHTPVFVGNGMGEDNLEAYLPYADGFIIGYAFKKIKKGALEVGGEEIDVKKVKKLVAIKKQYLMKTTLKLNIW